MMRACWHQNPEKRPSFQTLRQWLEEMMQDVSGVQYLDMDLNPSKDYYKYSHSQSETDSSDLAAEASLPLSPLLGRESGSETEGIEEVDDVASTSSSERKLTSCDAEHDPVMTKVTSHVIVHTERSPRVSSSSSSSSITETPPSSGTRRGLHSSSTKSVRFSRGRQAGTRVAGHRHGSKYSEGSSATENEAWNSENEACSPLPASHDAAWDDVFLADLKDTGWVESSVAQSQPHRVFPQEQHPCGLFRVSLLSDMTSVSDDFVLTRRRASALDSQGESICTSSSSGESVSTSSTSGESVTMSPPKLQLLQCTGSSSLGPSSRSTLSVKLSGPERCYRSPGQKQPGLNQNGLARLGFNRNQNRQPSRYQQSLAQQRGREQPSHRGNRHTAVTHGQHKAVQRGSNTDLKKPDSGIFKSFRGPIVFTKGASGPNAEDLEVTAL